MRLRTSHQIYIYIYIFQITSWIRKLYRKKPVYWTSLVMFPQGVDYIIIHFGNLYIGRFIL